MVLRQDLAARVDTWGDRFVTELDGGIVTERGIAGELLNRWGDRLWNTGLEGPVGRFAGFAVFVGICCRRGICPELVTICDQFPQASWRGLLVFGLHRIRCAHGGKHSAQ